jgi:type II secretory pathway component PulK
MRRHGTSRIGLNPSPRRRGTILIVTIWIVLVVSGLALVFAQTARVEALASANARASLEAEAIAKGALAFLLSSADGNNGSTTFLEQISSEARPIGEGYFWLVRTNVGEDDASPYGVTDEASRINLNSAQSDMLLKLPNMTAELADALIDWRDADADVLPNGAEGEYYLLLDEPYYCKDAPFETVEELLLVRGASAAVLYGEDANRNGILDENENDADASEPADNRNGKLDRGLLDYLTVNSAEPNTDANGDPRINVNDTNSDALRELLQEVIKDDRVFTITENIRRNRQYDSTLACFFRSGLTNEEFAQIADRLTVSNDENVAGLVNVNTAPREVLLCLPELDESDVDALITRRASPNTDLTSIAWVAETLPQEKAEAIGTYLTTRSYQFSADIVAVSGNGRAYRRYRVVVDARYSPPRVLRWQDLTHLGWPLDDELLSALRSGESLNGFSIKGPLL